MLRPILVVEIVIAMAVFPYLMVILPAHFTHTLPQGWGQRVTGVTSGEARWNGWTLSDMRHWTWAAGTDQRHYFTQGHDQFAIIDSKQQRLAERDAMDATMTTAPIDVTGQTAVALEYDQHYRQGKQGQRAQVTVQFDGGEPEVVDTRDDVLEGDFLRHPERPDARAYRDYRAYLLETSQVPGGFYAARSRAHALRLVVDLMLGPHDPYEALEHGRGAHRQQLENDS